MRDWQATLWPASFGGFPFFVEKGKDAFGKKIVVHEFPMRDEPYVEELGRAANHFDVNAYLASDAADIDAAGLKAMLVSFGAQVLVLPDEGPILCVFKNGTRDFERDRLGYIGFSLNFVAKGAAQAVASADSLGQLVSDAVSVLATGAATLMGNLSL